MASLTRFSILILALLLPLWSAGAYGELLEGLIERNDSGLWLNLTDGGRWPLRGRNSSAHQDLSRLGTGDFLVGEGIYDSATRSLLISSVNFVGLRRLLGRWRTPSQEIFEFHDFSRLNLYLPLEINVGERSIHRRELTYSLAPDQAPQWAILIVDSNAVDVGQLVWQQNRWTLKIFDRRTGKVAKTLTLSPVASTNQLH